MRRSTKLSAGAILSVVGISLLIAVLLGMLFLLLSYDRQDTSQRMRKNKLERNLKSAMALTLAEDYSEQASPEERIDLYGDEADSVCSYRYPWGIYEVAVLSAFEQRDTLRRAFMKGRQVMPQQAYVLYVQDEDRPLSVSGSTEIRGTAFLPPAGIRKAYIENKSYEADSTVFGPVKDSEKKLPAYQQNLLSQLKAQFFDTLTFQRDSLMPFAMERDSLLRSFYEKTLVMADTDSISLAGKIIRGNIVLISKKAIHVAADSQVEGALLFAPRIDLEAGFQGTLQAFAQDSLVVGASCRLRYPSAIALLEAPLKDGQVREFTPEIHIGRDAHIQGIVFSIRGSSGDEWLNRIRMEAGSLVEGEVYADGLLEMKGNVYGSTSCQRFILQTPSSFYDNFLLDATLDYHRRSRYYLSSPLLQPTGKGGIVQWLH